MHILMITLETDFRTFNYKYIDFKKVSTWNTKASLPKDMLINFPREQLLNIASWEIQLPVLLLLAL